MPSAKAGFVLPLSAAARFLTDTAFFLATLDFALFVFLAFPTGGCIAPAEALARTLTTRRRGVPALTASFGGRSATVTDRFVALRVAFAAFCFYAMGAPLDG